MNSVFGKLDIKDFIKAAVLAAIVVTWGALTPIFTAGSFPSWGEVGSALILGAKAAGAYIIKNLFTNSKGEPLTKEPK